MSVPQLVEKLQEHGVVAERKSVYDDLNTLNNLPDTKYEIVQQRGRGGGYYMTDAPFELAELKLLVDAVYASKFITARKSKILIDKLGQFTSTYRQEELDRKVLVSGRIKSTDEKILYTVDALHAAITAGEQVTFKYCDWNLQKRMVPRHDGQLYRVSPWVLVWENGNYYLIAYTEGGSSTTASTRCRTFTSCPTRPARVPGNTPISTSIRICSRCSACLTARSSG